jgi:hypothetical protein
VADAGVEERVRAALEVERAVVEMSLWDASRELSGRREALHRAAGSWKSRPEKADVIEVGDATTAYEATVVRARWLQDRLRQLNSSAEYERRVSRASAAPSDQAAASTAPGGRRFEPG